MPESGPLSVKGASMVPGRDWHAAGLRRRATSEVTSQRFYLRGRVSEVLPQR